MDAPQPGPAGVIHLNDGHNAKTHETAAPIEENVEYLQLKAAIDTRALNRRVWDGLWANVGSARLRTLELGAGIGTMLERMLAAGKLRHGEYHAMDHNSRLLDRARQRLTEFAAAQGWQAQPVDAGLRLGGDEVDLTAHFIKADLTETAWSPPLAGYDLLLAHAVLDLIDLDRHLPRFIGWLRQGGLAYFTLTFDGLTTFLPEVDSVLDRAIEDAYHASMRARRTRTGETAGGPLSGRRLLTALMDSGMHIVEAGASDWLIVPAGNNYRPGERAFLDWMLGTVQAALQGTAELSERDVTEWISERRRQLADHNLSLIVHQLDVCARKPVV